MKFFYPIAVRLDVKPTKDPERFRMFYREDFAKGTPPEVYENTVRAMRHAIPMISKSLKVRSGKDWISIAGILRREQIGDMMLGEFMHWGTIGNIPLRRIFETATSAVLLQASQAVPVGFGEGFKSPKKAS